jgi:predicted nucleotidyltransferase
MEDIYVNIYIDRIRQLVLSVLADEEANVYLFGSWARGTARHGSDVDVAVEFWGTPNERKIAELREQLEESTIPYRVDIVDMSRAAESLREEIRKDGIRWN